MSRPGDTLTKSLEFGKDRLDSRGPDKRSWMAIVIVAEGLNVGDEFSDARESATPDCFLRDEIEPDFDLIQPRCIRRCMVEMPSAVTGQPTLDGLVLMRSVVVDNGMDVELWRNLLVNVLEK